VPEGIEGLRAARPGPALAARLTRMAGPGGRYAGCDDAEVTLAAGRWAALESYAAAMRLGAVAEMIRRSPDDSAKPASGGDMPGCWEFGLGAQVGLELACSPGGGEAQLALAWQLQVRLPLTWAALHVGVLSDSKARLVASETRILSDDDAREAERQLSGYWAGKTWSQLQARITRIVSNLDPDAVAKKREQAQHLDARVRFWRETTGAAGLAGYGLPPDQALQASARVQARARAYRRAGIAGTWDQLRAAAYLDLLNGVDARDRLGLASDTDSADAAPATTTDGADCADPASGTGSVHTTSDGGGSPDVRPGTEADDGDADDDGGWLGGEDLPEGGDGGPGGDGNGGGSGGSGGAGPGGYGDGLAANVDLTLPLVTLLGMAERSGEAAGLGAIDPALARDLAAAAFRNNSSTFRIVITGPDGRATGFGTARERRRRDTGRGHPPPPASAPPAGPASTPTGQPATPSHPKDQPGTANGTGTGSGTRTGTRNDMIGVTVTGGLNGTAAVGRPGSVCRFWRVPAQPVLLLDELTDAGAASWGTWRLAAAGREWDITLIPLPVPGQCDHRFRTASYRPGATLRALIEIRDGGCAMPVCGRPARGSEWEHAVPWPEGPTCACNGGMHCTKDHRVKEAKGWTIEQRADGTRQWTTPVGLTYRSHHRQYPD